MSINLTLFGNITECYWIVFVSGLYGNMVYGSYIAAEFFNLPTLQHTNNESEKESKGVRERKRANEWERERERRSEREIEKET